MPLLAENRLRSAVNLLIAILLALGMWYVVVGSEQVDAQFEVRLEYRGLPENLTVRYGMVGRALIRLRGPAELMRGLHSRDLSHTVDLSGVQRGANVLPLNLNSSDFKAYEIIEISPIRLLLEVDALAEKTIPLQAEISPLPEASRLRMSAFLLDPAFVTVRGAESLIRPLESLRVNFDPSQDSEAGARAINVAIAAPDQITISPPITTIRYTMGVKTSEIELYRMVQLDVDNRADYEVHPARIKLNLEIPEDHENDVAYQASIRIIARPSGNLSPGNEEEVPILVILPSGSRLLSTNMAAVTIRLKGVDENPGQGILELPALTTQNSPQAENSAENDPAPPQTIQNPSP